MTHPYYEFFAGGGMARGGLGAPWTCVFANDPAARRATPKIGVPTGSVSRTSLGSFPPIYPVSRCLHGPLSLARISRSPEWVPDSKANAPAHSGHSGN